MVGGGAGGGGGGGAAVGELWLEVVEVVATGTRQSYRDEVSSNRFQSPRGVLNISNCTEL